MAVTKDQFITDSKGRKIAVIISIKKFDDIMEDVHDLSIIAERKKETTISFEKMKGKFLPKKK